MVYPLGIQRGKAAVRRSHDYTDLSKLVPREFNVMSPLLHFVLTEKPKARPKTMTEVCAQTCP